MRWLAWPSCLPRPRRARAAAGVSAFVVPLDRPGIGKAPGVDSLGVRGLGCVELVFDAVAVREDERIGEENQGFVVARRALEAGRIAIAAQALGVGQAALDEALRHARTRETFGRPIAQYQAIQWFLADMATELAAARMLTLKAAATADAGADYGPEAAMAKLAASEAAHKAADKAMQVLASAGYRRGSTVERLFRDAAPPRLPGHLRSPAHDHRRSGPGRAMTLVQPPGTQQLCKHDVERRRVT